MNLSNYAGLINLATLLAYVYDKRTAGSSWLNVRVAEQTLHLLELVGGSPAAFLAQRWLHHKIVKISYLRSFGLVLLVQVSLHAPIPCMEALQCMHPLRICEGRT
jgi:uncharacterized membrane protein YsdA (DUF1294 family)